jgi:tetratricopeptide (TPR) repeat protein
MRRLRVKACALILLATVLGGCSRSPEARRDKFVAAGKQLLDKKDYSRAILQFKNAAQAMPKDPEVYYQLGLAYNGASDFRTAVLAFRKTLELDPKHVAAQLRIAQLLASTNDEGLLKDAQNRLKALLEGAVPTTEMINTLALTELKLGNVENGVQSLERALTLAPGELASSLLLARAKLSQKDPKGAEEVLKKACNNVPKSSDAHRVLGEFYIYQQRMPEGEVQLRQAVELDPKSGPAVMDLATLQLTAGRKQEAEQNFKRLAAFDGYQSVYAVFLFQEKRYDEAIREFQGLSNRNPEDRVARTRLVVAYRLSGRAAEAEKVLSTTLKANPKDADALLQRAEILLEKRDYAHAEADLNQILRLRPNAPEVHYVLAKLNEERGNLLMCRQELSETLRLNPALQVVRVELAQKLVNGNEGRAALDVLNEAPEFQKRSTGILVQRNWALWQVGDLAAMRKGIDQGLSQEKSTDLLIQDGLWKMRAGDPSAARTALEEALKIDPSNLRALRELNQTYIEQKNTPMALQKVKEFAAKQPNSAPVQDFLGLMLLGNGDSKQARAAFMKAKTADPQFSKADLSLVQVDAVEGRFEDARKRLVDLLAHDQNNTMARRWLGNLEEVKADHSAAIEQFRKVVAANPSDPQASNNLAYLLAEYGNQRDEALKYAQKAVELAPERPAYCDTLGWVLYKKGLYASAIPYLERASAHPENVVWKYHLAMAYAKAGDSKRGHSTLEMALKLNPRPPEAKAAQEVVGASR